jgi:hypothetical protein
LRWSQKFESPFVNAWCKWKVFFSVVSICYLCICVSNLHMWITPGASTGNAKPFPICRKYAYSYCLDIIFINFQDSLFSLFIFLSSPFITMRWILYRTEH